MMIGISDGVVPDGYAGSYRKEMVARELLNGPPRGSPPVTLQTPIHPDRTTQNLKKRRKPFQGCGATR
jgi:hypothetical protein